MGRTAKLASCSVITLLMKCQVFEIFLWRLLRIPQNGTNPGQVRHVCQAGHGEVNAGVGEEVKLRGERRKTKTQTKKSPDHLDSTH